ncbi:TPA: hypothetical protein JIQ04_003452 [Acinetobacter baumannii]|nr:hypothetical protein [Acinetobacter baumannii]
MVEFTAEECVDHFNTLLEVREDFKNENGLYPKYLIQSELNMQKLLWGMSYMGTPPRANPEGTTNYFFGAELITGDSEGFYLELPSS